MLREIRHRKTGVSCSYSHVEAKHIDFMEIESRMIAEAGKNGRGGKER